MIKQVLALFILFLVGCTSTTVVERIDETKQVPVQNVTTITHPVVQQNVSTEPKQETIVEINGHYTMLKKVYSYKGNSISLKGVADGVCGIDVNGITYWIKEGETKYIENKLYIDVVTAVVSRGLGDNDACEVVVS